VFDWLFEGRRSIYLILAVAAALLLMLWWRNRSRRWLIGVGVVALLALGYFGLSKTIETPRAQVERKMKEMAAAVKTRDTERLFRHISDRFRFRTLDKAGFRQTVQGVFDQRWIDELEVWDFSFPGDSAREGAITIAFKVKAKGGRVGESDPTGRRAEATFVRDPDGQWRLQGFRVFKLLSTEEEDIQLPQ
jgi:hypothetical protein